MRSKLTAGLMACVIVAGGAECAWAAKAADGKVEFGQFTPPQSGGDFVEVNIGNTLISMAAKLVEKQEPEVSKMLASIESVQVNVIGLDDGNRESLYGRAKEIRGTLQKSGWEKIVTAQQKGQDVNIYLKTNGEDSVRGLTVVVMEQKKQAVFINVVGNIRPEQLSMLGERLHLESVKKAGKAVEKPQ